METDAKVKYRGIQIGKVKDIEYAGDQAKLTLAIDSSQLRYIPSNAKVRIAGTHGLRRQVGRVPAAATSRRRLAAARRAGAGRRRAARGQHAVPDADRRAAQDRPDQPQRHADARSARACAATATTSAPRWPGLNQLSAAAQSEAADAAAGSSRRPRWSANIYADAAPDLVTVFDNAPHDQQHPRRPAGQPQRHAAGRDRAGEQRHGDAGSPPPTTSSPRSSGCARR